MSKQFAESAKVGVARAVWTQARMHPAVGQPNRTSAPECSPTWPPKPGSRAGAVTPADATVAGCISPHPRAQPAPSSPSSERLLGHVGH